MHQKQQSILGLALTEQVAVMPQSVVVTVILQVPTALNVTRPVEETVAILVLLLAQVIVFIVALAGVIVAVNCSVFHTNHTVEVLFNDTQVTCIHSAVTAQLALCTQSSEVQVIIQFHSHTAFTNQV